MTYSALSIGIPEIRIYWKGTDTRLGFVSSVGLAMFFWCPMVVAAAINLGIISSRFTFTAYLLGLVALVVSGAGYLMDISEG
jgi:hypothetical protein